MTAIHHVFIGVVLVLLASIHLVFPKYFKWEKELKALSLINQEMMKVHTFFIALVVFLMGLLCITSSQELINTRLGKKISLGFAIFWTARLIIQFFGYSSMLWKGKNFETSIHIIFSLFWFYISVVFWVTYFY